MFIFEIKDIGYKEILEKKNKDISNLTEKTITTKVRNKLREKIGKENVKVSCKAKNIGNKCIGECWIKYKYEFYE